MNYKSLKFSLGYGLSNSPKWLPIISRLGGIPSDRICTPKHDLCVEGFHRSGNTYLCFLIQNFNREIKLAHHTNGLGNIKLAINNKIPAICVIRDPAEAVSSLIIKDSRLKVEVALEHYINFNKGILEIKSKILLIDFLTIVESPDKTILKINEFSGLDLKIPESDNNAKKNYEVALSKIDSFQNQSLHNSIIPNMYKEEKKKDVKSVLKRNRLFHEAKNLYKNLSA